MSTSSSSSSPNGPPKLPDFRPLPETSAMNRLINKLLAPIFYLLFMTLMTIVVLPVYTMIKSMPRSGARKSEVSEKRQRAPPGSGNVRATQENRAAEFLDQFKPKTKVVSGRGEPVPVR